MGLSLSRNRKSFAQAVDTVAAIQAMAAQAMAAIQATSSFIPSFSGG